MECVLWLHRNCWIYFPLVEVKYWYVCIAHLIMGSLNFVNVAFISGYCSKRHCDRGLFLLSRFGILFISLLLTTTYGSPIFTYCISNSLKQSAGVSSCSTVNTIKPGPHFVENSHFTKQLIKFIFFSNILLISTLLLMSGDVHPIPGPDSVSSSTQSSYSAHNSHYSAILNANFSIKHLNIQSLLPKIDILEIETQSYDALVFTETWLSSKVTNDEILIPNFNPPFRKYGIGRLGGGVLY